MKEFKGTPGPWNVQFADEIYAGDGVENEQVATANDCHDACLIAAAPELLSALQEALNAQVLPEYHAEKAKAAIAKALGESR